MNQIYDNQHEATDRLRLERCPDCGYSLVSLPDSSVCPECGYPYDSSRLIVLYGWTSPVNASGPWGWCRISLEQVVLVIIFVALARRHTSWRRQFFQGPRRSLAKFQYTRRAR